MVCWASAVNFVWNYCNEASYYTVKNRSKWLSDYELNKLTSGISKELNIHSQTIQQICKEYVQKRIQFKKNKLSWRKSIGSRKSLGWIPCSSQTLRFNHDLVQYNGIKFKFWKSRPHPWTIKSASFNEDSRGRWYVNLVCEVEETSQGGIQEIGIDLGIKTQATLSDGRKFERENITKKYANKLAIAQRAGRKKQTKNIHAKIANIRKDWNHKTANAILKDAAFVVVGNVSSSKLAKTHLAKSVLDSGWSQLRSFLRYKAIRLGVTVKDVNENWTSRTCNVCQTIGEHQGLSGLSVREWRCIKCGTLHDRDVNAARNILRLGHQTPIKGISITKKCHELSGV